MLYGNCISSMPSILQELPDTSSIFGVLGFKDSSNLLPPPLLTRQVSACKAPIDAVTIRALPRKKRTKSETFDYIMWRCVTFKYTWCILNQWFLIHAIAWCAIIYRYISPLILHGFERFIHPKWCGILFMNGIFVIRCVKIAQLCPNWSKCQLKYGQLSMSHWFA